MELPKHLKDKINNFANKLSDQGIAPWRLVFYNTIPDYIWDECNNIAREIAIMKRIFNPREKTDSGSLVEIRICDIVPILNTLYKDNPMKEKRYRINNYDVIEKKDILLDKYMDYSKLLDEDGLIEFPKDACLYKRHQSSYPLPFGFRIGDYQALLHRYFRRGCYPLNHYNIDLLNALQIYIDGDKSRRIKIALEEDYIAIPASYGEYFEYDYWYGAYYDEKGLDDRNKMIGLAVHYSDPKKIIAGQYMNRTEFLWKYSDGIKTLEIEELYAMDDIFKGMEHNNVFLTKYLHLQRDINSHRFIHLDCAIKKYDNDAYINRLSTPINKYGHKVNKKKIFRIDGNIPNNNCFGIMHYFFRSNMHIPEYFGAQIIDERTT
ncbi:MAG: hypothetical protein WC901_04100 [Candidatus Margulisiibacteriota bacterium]